MYVYIPLSKLSEVLRNLSENAQMRHLIASKGFSIKCAYLVSLLLLGASCYKILFYVMKNDLQPACDCQIAIPDD